jgi:hypothetical protein
MKKNANKKQARLQSLDSAQLAQVAGGASMLTLAWSYEEGTGWHEFFYAAHMAQKYC